MWNMISQTAEKVQQGPSVCVGGDVCVTGGVEETLDCRFNIPTRIKRQI